MSSVAYEIPSKTRLVLIYCDQPAAAVIELVREALAHWKPVWLLLDGMNNAQIKPFKALSQSEPQLRVLTSETRRGEGGSILHALQFASKRGITHVLCLHPRRGHAVAKVRDFMSRSFAHPSAMIIGKPEGNISRRRLMNGLMHVETVFARVGDATFGFNLYPVEPLRRLLESSPHGRGNDFVPDLTVRLVWEGVRPVNVDCRVRPGTILPSTDSPWQRVKAAGRIVRMHGRLLGGMVLRLLKIRRWRRWQISETDAG